MKNTSIAVLIVTTLGSATLSACSDTTNQSTEPVGQTEDSLSTNVCPPSVPTELTPAADQSIKASFTGVGIQIYICSATSAGGFAWTFIAPQANLLNGDGQLAGTHFIGPTWQSNDGSSVLASKVAGVTVDETAIPWLLLTAKSHGSVQGRFSDVTSIQRLETAGGIAPPATDCDATHLGSLVQVPYTAQYVLYRSKGHGKVQQCAGN